MHRSDLRFGDVGRLGSVRLRKRVGAMIFR